MTIADIWTKFGTEHKYHTINTPEWPNSHNPRKSKMNPENPRWRLPPSWIFRLCEKKNFNNSGLDKDICMKFYGIMQWTLAYTTTVITACTVVQAVLTVSTVVSCSNNFSTKLCSGWLGYENIKKLFDCFRVKSIARDRWVRSVYIGRVTKVLIKILSGIGTLGTKPSWRPHHFPFASSGLSG